MPDKKVLVIHPTDPSTEFLKLVYKDKDFDVINDFSKMSSAELKSIIRGYDKIIMMGHGIGAGLFNPQVGGRFIIDDSFADLLKTKETVSIWCFSDEFFFRNDIPGFHTGMIISEISEQYWTFGDIYLDERKQLENMELFATALNECIDDTPENMKKHVLSRYRGNDKVTKFNRKNIIVL